MKSTLLHKTTWMLGLVSLLWFLYSCDAKVDMEHIDTTMQTEMSLAVPVGNIHYTAKDLFGNEQMELIMVDDNGIFHFIDTVDIPTKIFHALDMAQYFGENEEDFKIYEQLNESGMLTGGKLIGIGEPVELVFPIRLTFKDINVNLLDERLDSVQITDAIFTSSITKENLSLPWNWINSISIVLGEQFHHPQCDTICVYNSNTSNGYSYGVDIPVNLNAFTLSLMRDEKVMPGNTNVVNECSVRVLFNITIPRGDSLAVTSNSTLHYYLKAQFVDYKAAWGFFQASNQMRDRDVMRIDSLWSDWNNLQNMRLRFMEPQITAHAYHHIAAPLRVYIDTIMAINNNKQEFATWDGNMHCDYLLENVLNPYTTSFNDSVWNQQIFDQSPSRGCLDKLFDIRPDSLVYNFHIVSDKNHPGYTYPQHRITKNTEIHAYALADMPFKLNDSSAISFTTVMDDVNFGRLKLDSILHTANAIKESNAKHIKLYLNVMNSMPFDINLKVKFLKQDNSEMKLNMLKGIEDNVIALPVPKMVRNSGEKYSHVTEPSNISYIVDVEEQQFDSLEQCKRVEIEAFVGNNPSPCVIDTTTSLSVQLGIAADVEAIYAIENKKE